LFFGIILALLAAVLYNAGFVLEKRALRDLPPISVRRPGRMIRLLCTSRPWLTGFLVMGMGLMCQVVVMSLVPLSVAQPIQLAGLAILVVFSAVLLDERTTPREWAGLGVLGLSLLLICLSMEPTRLGLRADTGVLLGVAAGTVLVALCAFCGAARLGRHTGRPVLYGAASGLLYGAAALQTKGVAGFLADRSPGFAGRTLASPYPYLYLLLSGAGLLLFQTALQRGRASIVVPVSSVVGSVYAVLAGTAVFGEPLPEDPVRFILRGAGFAAAIAVVVLMPRREGESEPMVPAPALVPDRAI
jgi:drug/metabolite transporter (DMT)-like permease